MVIFENFAIENYYGKIIGTIFLFLLVYILKIVIRNLVKKFAIYSTKTDNRSKLIVKYFNSFLYFLVFVFIIIIWGVDTGSLFSFVGAAITFIGVALFAQWSVLSNFTAGVIMFFAFPFKIGDTIRIQDKDFPIEAEIDDIRAFHTILITKEGERISYPNNLFLQKSVVVL